MKIKENSRGIRASGRPNSEPLGVLGILGLGKPMKTNENQ